jgi:hypothetical protein
MQELRRRVYHWLARVLRVQEFVNQAHDIRVWNSGYQHGYAAASEEVQEKMRPIFGERPVLIPVASIQFLDGPLQPMTGGASGYLPADSLKRMIDTTHLPVPYKVGKVRAMYRDAQARKQAR